MNSAYSIQLLVLLSMLMSFVHANHIQICQTTSNFGNSVSWGGCGGGGGCSWTNPPNTNDVAYFYDGGTETINCCGLLRTIDARIGRSGTLHFGIWRPSGGSYQLVGQFSQYCDSSVSNKCTYSSSGTNGITVLPNDLYGWWTSDPAMVQYMSWGGGGSGSQTSSFSSSVVTSYPTVAQIPATTSQNNFYGILVTVGANTKPTFLNLNSAVNLQQSSAVGLSVFTVSAFDSDVSDNSSIYIQMTSTSVYFNFDTASNVVSVISSLATAPSPVQLTFAVFDQCHQSSTATLTVTIINLPPVIQNLPNATFIPENTITRTFLYGVNATDTYDLVSCYVKSLSPATPTFTLEQFGSVWNLYTLSGSYFNYNTNTFHKITIECCDGKNYVQGNYTVYLIPNVPPVINNLPNSTSISEDTSVEVLLYTLNVTDLDSPSIYCTLGSGSTVGTGSKFRVRQKTGSSDYAIYTKAGVTFNYNAGDTEFKLDVQCSDERRSTNNSFYVYIDRNQPPVLTNVPAYVTLSTSSPIGNQIFTAAATDAENDQLYYSISCIPTGCPFTILDSGEILLNQEISSTSVVGYDVAITCRDRRNNGTTRILTVTILDINDLPQIKNLNTVLNVPENSPVGASIVKTSCIDFDLTDALTYSIACTPASGNTYFSINPETGTVSTSPATEINYEVLPVKSFNCTVTCSDGQATDAKWLQLVVNDVNEAPTFVPHGFSIVADEGPAGKILRPSGFSTFDPDNGDTKQFTLDCGTYTGYFALNSSNGITSYAMNYDVDAGTRPSTLNCTVYVTDSGGLTDSAPVDITIVNINDNVPVFSPTSYTYFVFYNDPISTTLGRVSATDADIGIFGQLTYSLNQTSLNSSYFGISSVGTLYVKNALTPLKQGATVSFEVLATDGGGNATKSVVTVVITTITTTPLSSTTDRYRAFFEDSRNIAWFTVGCVLLLAIIITSAFIYLTRTASLTKMQCQCCKVQRVIKRPLRQWNMQKNEIEKVPSQPEHPKPDTFRFWSIDH